MYLNTKTLANNATPRYPEFRGYGSGSWNDNKYCAGFAVVKANRVDRETDFIGIRAILGVPPSPPQPPNER